MAQEMNQNTNVEPANNDKGGFLWGLLGCCVPIAGLILFLVWKDQKPKTAKAAGIGALVCVIVGVIYYILMIVLGIGIASMGMLHGEISTDFFWVSRASGPVVLLARTSVPNLCEMHGRAGRDSDWNPCHPSSWPSQRSCHDPVHASHANRWICSASDKIYQHKSAPCSHGFSFWHCL